jgi:hypothetical protein
MSQGPSSRSEHSWTNKFRYVHTTSYRPFTEIITFDDQKWDDIRTQRADALDAILESLDTQLVPPDFHQASSDSSLFGSQHSDDEPERETHDMRASSHLQQSPTLTVRDGRSSHQEKAKDRKKWKTLRDFVDERAIEDVLETIENDRNALDVSVRIYYLILKVMKLTWTLAGHTSHNRFLPRESNKHYIDHPELSPYDGSIAIY